MSLQADLDARRPERGAQSSGFQIPAAVLAAAEAALNRYIAMDPEGAAGFAPLDGRMIAIEVTGIGAPVMLICGPEGVQLFGHYDAPPDCLIRGTPAALARMAMAERKDTQINAGAVEIEGDTGIAHDLSKAFAGLDVDWEEQAARIFGDPIAHQLGEGVRAVADWGRRTAGVLSEDLKEYLEEEGRLLPTRYEVDGFLGDVDTLRDDVERLQARVERLLAAPVPSEAKVQATKARRTARKKTATKAGSRRATGPGAGGTQ